MGVFSSIWSMIRFKTKLSTQERLQNIDDKLDKLDGSIHITRQHQKSAGFFLVTVAVVIYIPSIIIFYLWYFPVQWMHRVLYTIPFILFPVLVYFLKKLLQHIFINRISSNANAVKELKKDKKKILENVMDTETYKVAKELLHKYDPNRSLVEEGESPAKHTPKQHVPEGQALRRRTAGGVEATPQVQVVKPLHASVNGYPTTSTSNNMRTPAMPMPNSSMRTPQSVVRGPGVRGPVPIAPILPRERSTFDKFADYFIGDGPNNRFALICKQCYGHNGMVLTEEFEFTSYRCCYCGVFNPSRKQRLNAPRLEGRVSMVKRQLSDSSNSTTDAETSNRMDDMIEKEEENGVEENTVFEEDIIKQAEEREESGEGCTDMTVESSGVEEISKVDDTVEDVTNDSNEAPQSKVDESQPTDESKTDT